MSSAGRGLTAAPGGVIPGRHYSRIHFCAGLSGLELIECDFFKLGVIEYRAGKKFALVGNQGGDRVSRAMRGELDRGIEAVGLGWCLIIETAHHGEMQFPVTAFTEVVPPTRSGRQWIGRSDAR